MRFGMMGMMEMYMCGMCMLRCSRFSVQTTR